MDGTWALVVSTKRYRLYRCRRFWLSDAFAQVCACVRVDSYVCVCVCVRQPPPETNDVTTELKAGCPTEWVSYFPLVFFFSLHSCRAGTADTCNRFLGILRCYPMLWDGLALVGTDMLLLKWTNGGLGFTEQYARDLKTKVEIGWLLNMHCIM
jgi:hypothetical protein